MKQKGFTLIEMIVTIVVAMFLFLGIAGFVQFGMKGYADSIDRQRLQTQAQFVLEKMSREIKHAVPNSFDVPVSIATQRCLSFYPIKFSGFYSYDSVVRDGARTVDFLIGQDSPTLGTNDFMVVNPTRQSDLTENNSGQRISVNTTEVVPDPDNVHQFSRTGSEVSLDSESIANRHFIYDVNSLITYCLNTGTSETGGFITRNGETVAANIDAAESEFRYLEPSLHRGGLVHIKLRFSQSGEVSDYLHDVQVQNVP